MSSSRRYFRFSGETSPAALQAALHGRAFRSIAEACATVVQNDLDKHKKYARVESGSQLKALECSGAWCAFKAVFKKVNDTFVLDERKSVLQHDATCNAPAHGSPEAFARDPGVRVILSKQNTQQKDVMEYLKREHGLDVTPTFVTRLCKCVADAVHEEQEKLSRQLISFLDDMTRGNPDARARLEVRGTDGSAHELRFGASTRRSPRNSRRHWTAAESCGSPWRCRGPSAWSGTGWGRPSSPRTPRTWPTAPASASWLSAGSAPTSPSRCSGRSRKRRRTCTGGSATRTRRCGQCSRTPRRACSLTAAAPRSRAPSASWPSTTYPTSRSSTARPTSCATWSPTSRTWTALTSRSARASSRPHSTRRRR